jgi:hypothetical protein
MYCLEEANILKRITAVFLILVFCLTISLAYGERRSVVKDSYYLGAMRVVRCKEFVSLRETPDKTAAVLAKVPLDAIVYYCSNNVWKYAPGTYRKQADLFIRCEYEGQEGYIMKQYLEPAPEYEPVVTRTDDSILSRDEIIGQGTTVLEWKEFNVSVLASRELVTDGKEQWETLRAGCFIDDSPIWGYTEQVQYSGEEIPLTALMGGTEDEPQVLVYDAAYGLIMLDLMDGTEVWTLSKDACPLGDLAAYAVGIQTGILYAAGSDGPDPVAISPEGRVLWRSAIDDPEIYGAEEVTLHPNDITVRYSAGMNVVLDYYDGTILSIADE